MESTSSSALPATGHSSVYQVPRLKPSLLRPLTTSQVDPSCRTSHINFDTFSPVNANGSFEYDRVLKSGEVFKRARKTKKWKSCYLVLRPNLLSIYKSPAEARLHKQISLSELSAVAYLKDPKGRRNHVFGLFSPARNFHLQASNEAEARAWVELIRVESRIDDEEQGILLGSPSDVGASDPDNTQQGRKDFIEQGRVGSSSPELPTASTVHRASAPDRVSIRGLRKPSDREMDYSGDDLGLHSEHSDMALSMSIPKTLAAHRNEQTKSQSHSGGDLNQSYRSGTEHNGSQMSIVQTDQYDARVIRHGFLLCLKSKGGVKQWKRHWVVLRSKNLAFYKSEDEYAAHLILPLSNIINAVEIDPVSKSKTHCMQIIVADKRYRFCAPNEEALARWLGALKSHLARRKEGRQ